MGKCCHEILRNVYFKRTSQLQYEAQQRMSVHEIKYSPLPPSSTHPHRTLSLSLSLSLITHSLTYSLKHTHTHTHTHTRAQHTARTYIPSGSPCRLLCERSRAVSCVRSPISAGISLILFSRRIRVVRVYAGKESFTITHKTSVVHTQEYYTCSDDPMI